MAVNLKELNQQVIVITGASSGIGLTTARLAAKEGAKVVLASRSEQAMKEIVEEIRAGGGEAISVVADVSKEQDVQRIADEAIEHFGGIDTWVNNAGVSIYGRIEEVSMEDHHRLFQTNFWGVVLGSRTAVRHLRERGGGALINLGSVLSDIAIPLQGMYSASKHAVKGFTNALRVELEEAEAGISVTLIKPNSIDTPYSEHAKNYLGHEPRLPPPVYDPQAVAEAIIHCAQHPERDIIIGGAGKFISTVGTHAPRTTDKVMETVLFDMQQSDRIEKDLNKDSLHTPRAAGRERSDYPYYHTFKSSIYTRAALHPMATALTCAALGAAGTALWHRGRGDRHG